MKRKRGIGDFNENSTRKNEYLLLLKLTASILALEYPNAKRSFYYPLSTINKI